MHFPLPHPTWRCGERLYRIKYLVPTLKEENLPHLREPPLIQNSSFLGLPLDRVVTAFGSLFKVSFFHFILLFWNQVFTCNGVRWSSLANLFLSCVDRYFIVENFSSIRLSWDRENTVRVLWKRRLSSRNARKYFGSWKASFPRTWGGAVPWEKEKEITR